MLLWKLLKTSFCAVCAIIKCTSLQPTQSQEYQPGEEKHIKNKNKKSQRRFKVRTKTKKM